MYWEISLIAHTFKAYGFQPFKPMINTTSSTSSKSVFWVG